MKIGDLVRRKRPSVHWHISKQRDAIRQLVKNGIGVVVDKKMAGQPLHDVVTVLYPRNGRQWDIAESLMEVVSES